MQTRRSSRTNRTAHKERKDSIGTKKAPKLGRDNESEGEEASGRNRNLYLKTNKRKDRAANTQCSQTTVISPCAAVKSNQTS